MEIKHIHLNIVRIRKAKGYSHEYMAIRLDISQAAYCKLEHNKTKLYVERLYQIADILEVDVAELLSIDTKFQFTQNNKENSVGYLQHTANVYQENVEHLQKLIEVYEARIKDKDVVIQTLQKVIKE